MSLLNLAADKLSGAALANSVALSKFTNVTFAQANTSLPKIATDTFNTTRTAFANAGGSEDALSSPITAMKNYAVSADPVNAAFYQSGATSAMTNIEASASAAMPGYNNSLFGIQTSLKESMAGGVDSFGAAMNTVNPSVASAATGIGVGQLGSVGNIIDSASSSAFGVAKGYVADTVSGINNTIADNAAQAFAVPAPDVVEIPEGGGDAGAESAPGGTTSAGIDEEDTEDGVDEGDSSPDNTTDIIYQDVKVYIEGVQVPFESVSVSQSIGQLPSAMIQIPPQAGLLDIARYYQPKVHIFFTDNNHGGDRLLFWGHIVASNYAMSQQQGNATIAFQCVHKNALLQQITFEWSGSGVGTVSAGGSQTDPTTVGAAQANNLNSEASMIRALQGISGKQEDAKDLIRPTNPDVLKADPTLLDQRFFDFEKRMVGMPTAIMNLWNQQKLELYANEKLNIIFSKMFIPLLEDGIRFFDRLSGHNFLEDQISKTRVKHCNDKSRPELSKLETMLPPAFRMDIQSAVQTQMAISSLKSVLGFSGELTSFYDLFTNFYYSIEYELLTLASPAEVPVDPDDLVDPDDKASWNAAEKMAIETIIKPQLPFYYAPICNVLLPNMYHSINISQQEGDIPTRITGISTAASQASESPFVLGINYRAPQSVRESIALGRQFLHLDDTAKSGEGKTMDLKDTTGWSYNLPGRYELGRGIKHKKIVMPNWLTQFTKDQDNTREAKKAGQGDEQLPERDSLEYKNLVNLHLAWVDKYGYKPEYDEETDEINLTRDKTLDPLNPYSTKANIMAYERLLFSATDYEFTKEVVKSKSGTVDCLFNPYIVPGYPMDIIDSSPNHPSFHAMCSSVTHSASARGITTGVGFLAAITYTEMSNYYMQPIHPWLRNALCMINVERSAELTEGGDTEVDEADVKGKDSVTEVSDDIKAQDEYAPYAQEEKKSKIAKAKKSEQSTAYGLEADPAYDANKGDVITVREGLIDNPRAKAVADQFYRSVFGVGAADPTLIYNFEQGGYLPVARQDGEWVEGSADQAPMANGGEGNDNLTGVGNLRLVSRPIEGKRSIEAKFDLRFIDLSHANYAGENSVVYANEITSDGRLLEPGASMFLTYPDVISILDTVAVPGRPPRN